MSFDGKAFGAEMTAIVKGYVDRATAPLEKRIAELEARPLPERGEKGEPGERGERGETGIGVKDALIDRSGVLVLTLSDGTRRDLGVVIGKDGSDGQNGADGAPGEPGKDGRDGFDLESFDCVPIDERTIALKFQQGDTVHSFELEFPIPVYRGIFKQGETYKRGEIVTWGGSAWHCNEETGEKPDSGPWSKMVNRGRDGKDAK
jgi:hypothetical protein